MKISFTNKISETDHQVFIVSEKTNKITSFDSSIKSMLWIYADPRLVFKSIFRNIKNHKWIYEY